MKFSSLTAPDVSMTSGAASDENFIKISVLLEVNQVLYHSCCFLDKRRFLQYKWWMFHWAVCSRRLDSPMLNYVVVSSYCRVIGHGNMLTWQRIINPTVFTLKIAKKIKETPYGCGRVRFHHNNILSISLVLCQFLEAQALFTPKFI